MITINRQRLLERFLRYVRYETTANADSTTVPSSPGQLELGKLLRDELDAMGLDDVHQDSHGLVWATIPTSVPGPAPTILLNAHIDTSPDAPGANVRPQVIQHYEGGDIVLGQSGRVIRASETPELAHLIGHTLITTDGTTLLGGDDKAGVATIMELAQCLVEHPHLPHGPVRILFTCDEEIGRGTDHVDLLKVNALAGYTLDGGGSGKLEAENFSGDGITIKVAGRNIHPSIGKGHMINAARGLSHILARLPLDRISPETTEGREGFIHPYHISGTVAYAEAKLLLRDFDTVVLTEYDSMIRSIAREVEALIPGLQVEVIRNRQYRNMADALANYPLVVELAQRAFQLLDRPCELASIRGGTDGAMLSEKGLPTPNLSVGEHNIHSELEYASLDEMVAAAEHMITLLDLWQQFGRA